MVWREWPIVAALLAVAAVMVANPKSILRALEGFMKAAERLRAQLRGFGWYPLAPRAETRGFSPRAARAVRIAGACLAAVVILAFLGSAGARP